MVAVVVGGGVGVGCDGTVADGGGCRHNVADAADCVVDMRVWLYVGRNCSNHPKIVANDYPQGCSCCCCNVVKTLLVVDDVVAEAVYDNRRRNYL